MRLKANQMGFSLNQRGLFAGVVRSTEDRTVKTNTGAYYFSPETRVFLRILVSFLHP